MRERKYIKIRTDMYEDIKMKIIDRSPRRDLVHYIWSRTMTLAGKVNREGKLYMSKNIPYTIQTLAIEFNRECDEVKLAFDLLIELEMVELIEGSIYVVKNFVKHQNIKVKEESKSEYKEIGQNKKEDITDEENKKEVKMDDKELKEIKEIKEVKDEKDNESKEENNLKISEKAINKVKEVTLNSNTSIKAQEVSSPILLQKEKLNRNDRNKNKSKNTETEISVTEEQEDDECLFTLHDGDFVLREGENIIWEFNNN